MLLTNAAIKNRTTVGVLVLLIAVTGVYSYLVIPREAAPDVKVPIILITTTYEGVSPEDVESSVTNKIEKELTGVGGVKELRSSSAEGTSVIVVEFYPDVEIEEALRKVKDKVDLAKADLPADAEDPVVEEVNIAEFPIMIVNLSGKVSPVRLKAIADELEDAIEQIPGVLNVDVLGALEREIRLEMNPDRVTAYRLSIPELLAVIPSENVNVSAGGLETTPVKFNIRVPAEFARPEEVDGLSLTVRDGRTIFLTDVVEVRDTFKDRASYSRLDGVESVTLSIQKRVGANIVHIADAVKAVLAEAQRRVPLGVSMDVTLDVSKDVRMMVKDLENNILSGLVLVVAVLVVFMGFRTSLIVALAIPLSMLISFTVILGMGYTMNFIVLFSLILALGMLVDNAIVIVENIYRHVQMGMGRAEAAMRGTGEVAWPVITSTATTIAAFSPLLFWRDVMGDFMKYIPITLIITLSSSLFVALVISPTVCSLVGGGRPRRRGRGLFVRSYRAVLAAALANWFVTLPLVLLLLVGVGRYYAKRNHGVELFPDFDPRRAIVNIRSPQGTNIRESYRLARLVEERIDAPDIRPYLVHTITNVGASGSGGISFGGATGGPHVANLTLLFHDFEERQRPSAEVVADVRRRLAGIAGAEIKVEKEQHGPPTGAPVTVRIIGEDIELLRAASRRAQQAIAGTPGLVNLRSDFEAARPELAFHVDRQKAMLLGVNTAVVGNFLKTAIFGSKVGTYRQFNDEYDITVRLPVSQRTSLDDLLRLHVPSRTGAPVPIGSLGDFAYSPGLGTINHVDRKRVITLTGDAEGRQSNEVLRDVQAALGKMELPRGYAITYAGEKEEQDKARRFLSKAFVVALLLIVLILVAQFNTLSVPVVIMTTVVLSMIGVLAGLLICRMPFGIIMTGIGAISLAGVVVNNAIVLLDYTRQLQRRGLGLVAAAVEAGTTRLRPVLLTASTTILGLVPMATGVSFDFHVMQWATRSESSQWWAAMATAVIFGLGFATLLTLVVVPVLYVTAYRLLSKVGLGGLRAAQAEPA